MAIKTATLETLSALSRKVLWLSCWTIHHANHVRPNSGRIEGQDTRRHPPHSRPSCRRLFPCAAARGPRRREAACEPGVPRNTDVLGRQTRDELENFRGYKGAQSYPSRTKDVDDVDSSTGSVGLGVAQTLFASLVQDYSNRTAG